MTDDHYAQRILDLCVIFISGSIAYALRFDTFRVELDYSLPLLYFAVFASLCLSTLGAYQRSSDGSFGVSAFTTLRALVLGALIAFALVYLTKTGELYSRVWFSLTVTISYISILGYKLTLKKLEQRVVRSKKIILLGNGTKSNRILEESKSSGSLLQVYGVFTDDIDADNTLHESNHQVLGSLAESIEYIERLRHNNEGNTAIAEVWVTHPVFSKKSDQQLRMLFKNSAIKLVYIPEYPDSLEQNQTIQFVQGVATINSALSAQQQRNQLLKRAFDQLLAWPLLIVLSPVLLIVAAAIRYDSEGPVIYRQQRYGLDGSPFIIFKFRTMSDTQQSDGFKQAQRDDPRVTAVGRFLRRSSLDELPQLFNVINGTMSLVGPRPHPNKMNEEYRSKISHYMQRHNVRPGITGLAQVRGFRGETSSPESIENRISSDLEYVKLWSLTLDIKILFKTIIHVLIGKNAY